MSTNLPGDEILLTPQQENVVMKLDELQQMLQTAHPAMPRLLRDVHRELLKDPELVHLLKPEQTAVYVSAAQRLANITIVAAATKKSTTGRGKSLKDIGLEDI